MPSIYEQMAAAVREHAEGCDGWTGVDPCTCGVLALWEWEQRDAETCEGPGKCGGCSHCC